MESVVIRELSSDVEQEHVCVCVCSLKQVLAIFPVWLRGNWESWGSLLSPSGLPRSALFLIAWNVKASDGILPGNFSHPKWIAYLKISITAKRRQRAGFPSPVFSAVPAHEPERVRVFKEWSTQFVSEWFINPARTTHKPPYQYSILIKLHLLKFDSFDQCLIKSETTHQPWGWSTFLSAVATQLCVHTFIQLFLYFIYFFIPSWERM